jgi:hypothetical protein
MLAPTMLLLWIAASIVAGARQRYGVGNVRCSMEPSRKFPVGHKEPLGCNDEPTGTITEIPVGVVPDPRTFFERHIAVREPAVLRGAVMHAPGLARWSDKVLQAEYGDLHVKLEGRREKRDEDSVLVGNLSKGRDTLGHFVARTRSNQTTVAVTPVDPLEDDLLHPLSYEQAQHVAETGSGLDGYVVSQLPEPMSKDVLVPAVASCGALRSGLLEANLWVSSGNTSSMLHRDADNVFNCVYRGSKTWTLVDPSESCSCLLACLVWQ